MSTGYYCVKPHPRGRNASGAQAWKACSTIQPIGGMDSDWKTKYETEEECEQECREYNDASSGMQREFQKNCEDLLTYMGVKSSAEADKWFAKNKNIVARESVERFSAMKSCLADKSFREQFDNKFAIKSDLPLVPWREDENSLVVSRPVSPLSRPSSPPRSPSPPPLPSPPRDYSEGLTPPAEIKGRRSIRSRSGSASSASSLTPVRNTPSRAIVQRSREEVMEDDAPDVFLSPEPEQRRADANKDEEASQPSAPRFLPVAKNLFNRNVWERVRFIPRTCLKGLNALIFFHHYHPDRPLDSCQMWFQSFRQKRALDWYCNYIQATYFGVEILDDADASYKIDQAKRGLKFMRVQSHIRKLLERYMEIEITPERLRVRSELCLVPNHPEQDTLEWSHREGDGFVLKNIMQRIPSSSFIAGPRINSLVFSKVKEQDMLSCNSGLRGLNFVMTGDCRVDKEERTGSFGFRNVSFHWENVAREINRLGAQIFGSSYVERPAERIKELLAKQFTVQAAETLDGKVGLQVNLDFIPDLDWDGRPGPNKDAFAMSEPFDVKHSTVASSSTPLATPLTSSTVRVNGEDYTGSSPKSLHGEDDDGEQKEENKPVQTLPWEEPREEQEDEKGEDEEASLESANDANAEEDDEDSFMPPFPTHDDTGGSGLTADEQEMSRRMLDEANRKFREELAEKAKWVQVSDLPDPISPDYPQRLYDAVQASPMATALLRDMQRESWKDNPKWKARCAAKPGASSGEESEERRLMPHQLIFHAHARNMARIIESDPSGWSHRIPRGTLVYYNTGAGKTTVCAAIIDAFARLIEYEGWKLYIVTTNANKKNNNPTVYAENLGTYFPAFQKRGKGISTNASERRKANTHNAMKKMVRLGIHTKETKNQVTPTFLTYIQLANSLGLGQGGARIRMDKAIIIFDEAHNMAKDPDNINTADGEAKLVASISEKLQTPSYMNANCLIFNMTASPGNDADQFMRMMKTLRSPKTDKIDMPKSPNDLQAWSEWLRGKVSFADISGVLTMFPSQQIKTIYMQMSQQQQKEYEKAIKKDDTGRIARVIESLLNTGPTLAEEEEVVGKGKMQKAGAQKKKNNHGCKLLQDIKGGFSTMKDIKEVAVKIHSAMEYFIKYPDDKHMIYAKEKRTQNAVKCALLNVEDAAIKWVDLDSLSIPFTVDALIEYGKAHPGVKVFMSREDSRPLGNQKKENYLFAKEELDKQAAKEREEEELLQQIEAEDEEEDGGSRRKSRKKTGRAASFTRTKTTLTEADRQELINSVRLRLFQQADPRQGCPLQVMIVHGDNVEGLDLTGGVKFAHQLTSFPSQGRQIQFNGRIRRLGSHCRFEDREDWTTYVVQHFIGYDDRASRLEVATYTEKIANLEVQKKAMQSVVADFKEGLLKAVQELQEVQSRSLYNDERSKQEKYDRLEREGTALRKELETLNVELDFFTKQRDLAQAKVDGVKLNKYDMVMQEKAVENFKPLDHLYKILQRNAFDCKVLLGVHKMNKDYTNLTCDNV